MPKPLTFVIEDDPPLSRIFTLALSDLFNVEAITDGSQALVRLSEVVPRLIILDINLPGASGVQILNSVRADPRLNSTRVILVTADTHQAKDLHDKADLVLLKPVSVSQLREFASRMGGY